VERPRNIQESHASKEKGGLRALRTVLLGSTLAAILAMARADKEVVDAADRFITNPQTPHSLRLETPPNQEYDRIINRAETLQAGTSVQGYIEVPDGQQMDEADRQAFDNILKGVRQWFYDNIGATFEIGGNVQFVTRPDIQKPATLDDFFEGERPDPRIGAFVSSSGLGAVCDGEINRTTFLVESLAEWRNQNANTPVPIPADDLRFGGPCPGNSGLGAAYLGNDWLDREPQDRAVLAVVLDIAIANRLGDANAPTLEKFLDNPQFTPEQVDMLRDSPLFPIKNPNWQAPQEPIHLLGDSWNLVTIRENGCQPVEEAVKPLTNQGIKIVIWGFKAGQWWAYNSEFSEASDQAAEICRLDVVWILPDHPVDW